MQTIFKELYRPSSCFKCSLCDVTIPENIPCLQHACESHTDEMANTSYEHLLSLLVAADSMDAILNFSKSLSNAHMRLLNILSILALYIHCPFYFHFTTFFNLCICPLGH